VSMTKINNDTFDQFMYRIDEVLESRYGLTSLDLPDVDWYSYYDSDLTIGQVLAMAHLEWETM
jgi:hypothetical protein